MAILTALNAPVDMGALRSYAGTVTTSTVSGGTLQTIRLNAADFVEFTLANVGGQQVVTSMIQARFLPGVDGLADNLVTEPVFILESLSANPSLVTSLAGGANTTQTIAALLQGPDQINGSSFADRLLGYNGNDLITGAGGNDTIDGGDGINVAAYAGVRAEYTIALQPNGSYLVIDNVAGRDGTDTVSNIEQLQFIDDVFDLASFDPAAAFVSLVNANASQAKAISAAYQILLGGVPAQAGYNFLITSNLTSNFGAGPGPVFNDENIFINVANSLVQGNATAAAKFNALATGTTLQDKIGALYGKLIPLGQQTAEGRAFFTGQRASSSTRTWPRSAASSRTMARRSLPSRPSSRSRSMRRSASATRLPTFCPPSPCSQRNCRQPAPCCCLSRLSTAHNSMPMMRRMLRQSPRRALP